MTGDFVCFDPRTTVTKSGYIKSRFLDDKLSVGILLGYAKYLKEEHVTPERMISVSYTHLPYPGIMGAIVLRQWFVQNGHGRFASLLYENSSSASSPIKDAFFLSLIHISSSFPLKRVITLQFSASALFAFIPPTAVTRSLPLLLISATIAPRVSI